MEVGPRRLEGDGLDLLHGEGTQSALHRLSGTYCAQALGGGGKPPMEIGRVAEMSQLIG